MLNKDILKRSIESIYCVLDSKLHVYVPSQEFLYDKIIPVESHQLLKSLQFNITNFQGLFKVLMNVSIKISIR